MLLVLVEGGALLLNKAGFWPFSAPTYDQTLITKDNILADIDSVVGIWRQPNMDTRITGNCFDIQYSSNSFGARDIEWDLSTSENGTVFLGDSYIEGYGINTKSRVSDLYGLMTNRETYNLAISGHFGPTQYRLIYEKLYKMLPHDEVIIGLNLPTDISDEDIDKWRNRRRYRPYLVGDFPDFEIEYGTVALDNSVYSRSKNTSQSMKVILNEYSFIYHALLNLKGVKMASDPVHIRNYGEKFDKALIDRIAYNLIQIDSLAGKNKKVYCLLLPNREVLDKEGWIFEEYFNQIKEYPGVENINFISIRDSLQDTDSMDIFLPCDEHWNSHGNRLIAQILKNRIHGN
ncbi:hypothetical protein [Fulvivirga sedimenti]|uniref:AlgX/AlgJ SGNH hydrolase-like domain-containing protein n=1 Tax=Fulvivirga sedimenti TaxID=2879465 RepID=A0A9X1HJP8_9BACT|nr:hypothetical protein [Fulvivirga sedimenti]MCA6073419.1 hypothetical protein [Fulvivirga sedimenti]